MKDLVELALSWLEAKRLADALCPKFDRTVIDSLVTFTAWNRRDGDIVKSCVSRLGASLVEMID
jgi:hypothetical protein